MKLKYFSADLETATEQSMYYDKHCKTFAYIVSQCDIPINYFKGWNQTTIKEKLIFTLPTKVKTPYLHFQSVEPIRQWLQYMTNPNQDYDDYRTVYFHNGGRFDFEFLKPYLDEYQFVTTRDELEQKTVMMTKSDRWSQVIIKTPYVDNDGKLKYVTLDIRDSRHLIQQSVLEMSEVLVKQGKMEATKDNTMQALDEWERTMQYNKRMLDYAVNDVVTVALTFAELSKMFPNKNLPTTTSSLAFSIFSKDKGIKQSTKKQINTARENGVYTSFQQFFSITNLNQMNNYFSENAIYRGGLTTINPHYSGRLLSGDNLNLFVDDVVSQYPHKMTYPMPSGEGVIFKDNVEKIFNTDLIGFFKVRFTNIRQRYSKLLPPYLPRNKSFHLVSDRCVLAEYCYSTPDLTVYVSREELQEIYLSLCDYDTIEWLECVVFTSKKDLFSDYVNQLIKEKSDGKKEGNLVKEKRAKLLMNGLYGKFAERLSGGCKVFDGEEWISQENEVISETRCFPVGAYITSLSRMYLVKRAKELIKNGLVVLGHDTDSNFSIGRLEDMKKLPVGKNLGDWDWDEKSDTYDYGVFVASKKYKMWKKEQYEVVQETDEMLVVKNPSFITSNCDSLFTEIKEDMSKDEVKKWLKLGKCGCAGIPKPCFEQNPFKSLIAKKYSVLARCVYYEGVILQNSEKNLFDIAHLHYWSNPLNFYHLGEKEC